MFYIAVTQLGRKCSKEAIVTAQARLPEKQMSEILAEEEGMLKEITPYILSLVSSMSNKLWLSPDVSVRCSQAEKPIVRQD